MGYSFFLRSSTAWLVFLLAVLQLPLLEGLTVKICIPYPNGNSRRFRDRCTASVSLANTADLEFTCVAGGSVDKCVSQIADGEAHLTTLDGGDVIRANRNRGLQPLIVESTRDGVQGGSYYAVAVVNEDFCTDNTTTLADLRGSRSCHTGYRKSAGWRIPVGTLLDEVDSFRVDTELDKIEDDAELVAAFFSEVCAPRVSENGPNNTDDGAGASWNPLCTACKGDCSSNDQYYDYSGAFRCLMEGEGDVAFVKHSTVLDYAADGNADEVFRAWANKTQDEFRLLCRDGGCREVTAYRDCHLSIAPSHAMVTSQELGYEGVNETLGLQIQSAILQFADDEEFLNGTIGLTANFLWSSGTERLDAVTRGMETYLPSKAIDTYNEFDGLVGNRSRDDDTVTAIYCAYTEAEMNFCLQMLELESVLDSDIEWGCIQLETIEDCLQAIEDGTANWRTVSGSDAYIGFARYGLTSILAENGTLGNGYDYYSVAVVRSEFCEDDTTLADLKNTRSCHTGYRRNAGWDIPVGSMVSQGIMNVVAINPAVANDAETVANFFSESCAPYREGITPLNLGNLIYDPICSICRETCNSSSPYAGYEGAFTCLIEEAGDVAFVKHTTVFDYGDEDSLSDLRLVCPRTPGCASVEDFEDCNLGLVPTRSVVVSDSNTNKETLQREILQLTQTDAFIEFVFNEDSNPDNYIFNADNSLIELENGTESFLGGALAIFQALEDLDLELEPTVKVCIPYPASRSDIASCNSLFASTGIPGLVFECIAGETSDSCMQQLYKGEAHLTTLDGGDIFQGHRLHGLVPLIAEVGEGGLEGSYYSVAVVNEDFCNEDITLADLEGRNSCHTGYRKMAGWRIPVGTLISEVDAFQARRRNSSVEDDAELVANFFDNVCAPRVSGNGPVNTDDGKGALLEELCNGCKGNCLTNDQFYDYSGAFRCLMEGYGDVAFVKHTTVSDYASDGNVDFVERAWANKTASEFRLLCRDGGCASIEDYENCHLALVPSHALVGSAALGSDGELAEVGEAIKEGIVNAVENPDFFDNTRGLIQSFPFSSSTESLVPIEGGYEGYITDEAETALEAFTDLIDNDRTRVADNSAVFCAVTDQQMEACEANAEAIYSALESSLDWGCIQMKTTDDCLKALDEGEAHFAAGNVGEIYRGSQSYDLKPIAAEAIGPTKETAVYSVVLVKSEDCDNERLYLSDYAGATACFTELNSDSGWIVPISTMANQGILGIVPKTTQSSNVVQSILRYFSSVCIPHNLTSESASDDLCSACPDDCSLTGDYTGVEGALECMQDQENAVAITDSTVFIDSSMEGVNLICPYRTGCSETSQFLNCNFGETPTDAIVVSQNADSTFVSLLRSILIEASSMRNYTSILGTTRDSGELVSLGGTISSFLEDFRDATETMSKIETRPRSFSREGIKINQDN
eukprot:g6524.t1